jgi:hypothetical protein
MKNQEKLKFNQINAQVANSCIARGIMVDYIAKE